MGCRHGGTAGNSGLVSRLGPVAAGLAVLVALWPASAALAGPGSTALPATVCLDTIREMQWHLDALNVPAAHALTTGEGVVVAVIDFGVEMEHPDLQSQVLPGTGIGRGAGHNGRSVDFEGHGTALAGVIAA